MSPTVETQVPNKVRMSPTATNTGSTPPRPSLAQAENEQFRKQFQKLSQRSFRQDESLSEIRVEGAKAVTEEQPTLLMRFQQFRYWSGVLVNDTRVQIFIVYLIAINAIMMGIGTYDFVKNNHRVDQAFESIDMIFLVIFTIELAMQFAFYGWRLILDGWLVFDLIVVTMSWAFAELQIIRAFRIFRALRLITRVKVMKNLVLALFGVVPRMFAIAALLLLVSYIFAVMFTQLFKDLYEEGHTDVDYFGRIDKSFFTLFQIMTFDAWSDISRQVQAVPGYGWAWLPIIVFVVITGFVVVNLIIAVICDSISALNEADREKLHGHFEEEEESKDNDESLHENRPVTMSDRLNNLEDRTEALAKIQVESLKALHMLTHRLELESVVLTPDPASSRKASLKSCD